MPSVPPRTVTPERRPVDDADSSYPGEEPFRSGDGDCFFGPEEFVEDRAALVSAPGRTGTPGANSAIE
ncbi:hypothetical protein [Kitasatospora sp. NPDC002965]|uniref:hypothetical protein n=1 Tax=Kitasatospora sp. NPDC002965 TaxID=3154775 RepID=UPI0033AA0061